MSVSSENNVVGDLKFSQERCRTFLARNHCVFMVRTGYVYKHGFPGVCLWSKDSVEFLYTAQYINNHSPLLMKHPEPV